MSILAVFGFYIFDGLTLSGFWTSTATAIGGPLIEVGLITVLNKPDDFLIPFLQHSGYHYNDLGETGFFPLWIVPVYFLGGPAVGNLARGFYYNLLGNDNTENEMKKKRKKKKDQIVSIAMIQDVFHARIVMDKDIISLTINELHAIAVKDEVLSCVEIVLVIMGMILQI
eukprot:CAMPEP_0178957100 /NCGR_PEP_ID=MMETSP0789-20121207/10691_1 /TAXON_ID=3005 /ORGANISM="Rhizosolenia setigera, Strain CCMP 1694" /LENGTH=169 /DNA_ID=CAMNT_0020639241 /DNA_START=858 /DNA_END=1368 /DNA_ORIENTATION=-